MKKIILGLFALLSCVSLKSQIISPTPYPVTNAGGSIECMVFDSTLNILYVGGSFDSLGGLARKNLAAINVTFGSLTTWAPQTNGPVYGIDKNGLNIYVGGNFTTVNGLSRTNLACINQGGFLQSFSPAVNGVVYSICANNSRIYVGGLFTTLNGVTRDKLGAYNRTTHTISSWNPSAVTQNYPFTNVSKIGFYANKLYALGAISGSINQLIVIDSISALEPSYFYTDNTVYDFTMAANKLWVSGDFNSVDLTGSNPTAKNDLFAYDLNTANYLTYTNAPLTVPQVITNYNDSVYYSYSNIANNCDYFQKNSANGSLAVSQNLSSLLSNRFKNAITGNSKLFALMSTGLACINNNLANIQLGVYCLNPPMPGNFTTSTILACPGVNNITYTIPSVPYNSSYQWSYSGTGVTINGSGNSVTLNFSYTATSGILSVYTVNDCGLTSPPRTLAITMQPPVVVSAGTDKTITCTTTSFLVTATSTIGNAYLWQGPNAYSFNGQTAPINTPGTYTVTSTNLLNGCTGIDSMVVFIDTVHPIINPYTFPLQFNCAVTSITLNASTNNGSDLKQWYPSGGGSFPNPHTITSPNSFLFSATRLSNGCVTTDSVIITQNTTPPQLTMPPMDAFLFYPTTLTCDTDSVNLNAVTITPNAVIYWDNLGTGTVENFSNPYTAIFGGSFEATVVDTNNQCTATGIIFTQQDFSLPGLAITSDSVYLNCSFPTLILNADSVNSTGAILNWTGPSSFSSTDPATITTQGLYYVTSTKPANGCIRIDSVLVGLNTTLTMSVANDTIVCSGSNLNYTANVVGGNLPLTYQWSNGSISANTSMQVNSDTVLTVIATDQNNCIGKDTVLINVSLPIGDSLHTFRPCDSTTANGQITIYAYGGIPPYQYSINNGLSFQSNFAFTNLGFGNYSIVVKDTIGCTHSTSTLINQQTTAQTADFLVATSTFSDSTFVLVDISNPRPDSIWWELPSNTLLIGPDSTGTQYYLVVYGATTIPVIMHAQFGSCIDTDTAFVTTIPWDSTYANPNCGQIDSLNVYPNPAPGGQFNVYVKFCKKQTFAIYVFDGISNEVWRQSFTEEDFYSGLVTLPISAPGHYLLRVVGEYDSRNIIVQIPQ